MSRHWWNEDGGVHFGAQQRRRGVRLINPSKVVRENLNIIESSDVLAERPLVSRTTADIAELRLWNELAGILLKVIEVDDVELPLRSPGLVARRIAWCSGCGTGPCGQRIG
ncbi:hypothetical protein D3C72_1621050 [compost metagenome]